MPIQLQVRLPRHLKTVSCVGKNEIPEQCEGWKCAACNQQNCHEQGANGFWLQVGRDRPCHIVYISRCICRNSFQLGSSPRNIAELTSFSRGQWLFLVPLKGGRWHTIPQLEVYTTYILPSGGLYATYHLLGEPETTIEEASNSSFEMFMTFWANRRGIWWETP